MLSRFPEVPVLLVFFDEPLPQPLSVLSGKPEDAISIALLLSSKMVTKGLNTKISMNFNHANKSSGSENPVEAFVKFLLSDSPLGQAQTDRMYWQWEKLP